MTRPTPSTHDRALAEAFVAVEYDDNETICPVWLKQHRADLVRQAADIEMHKRLNAEWRARLTPALAAEPMKAVA